MDYEFFRDMIEFFGVEPMTETGASDEGDYGLYYAFPDSNQIEDDQLKELLSYFGIYIPFGEEFAVTDLMMNGIISICEGLEESEIEAFFEIEDDKIIRFYDFDVVRDELLQVVRNQGAPIGRTLREDEGSVPPEFGSFATEEYEYRLLHREILDYKQEMDNIVDMLKIENQAIKIKSLLLTSFILTESFIRAEVMCFLPEIEKSNLDPVTKELLNNYFNDKLEKTAGRQELYRKYFGNTLTPNAKLGDIPFVKLRNTLAHDLEMAYLNNGKIKWKERNKQGELVDQEEEILSIIQRLKNFSGEVYRKRVENQPELYPL